MAAANTRRITNIRQRSSTPDNELLVDYASPTSGETTGGRVGRQNVTTATVMADLVQDFQDLARRYEALEQEVAELRGANPSQPHPRPVPPVPVTDGAILKQPGDALTDYYAKLDQNPFVYDDHGPVTPLAAESNFHRSTGG